MKKLAILSIVLLCGLCCQATELNSIFYGIRNGIDVLSDVNRLRGQVNQTNAQQQEKVNKQPVELPQATQQPVQQNSYYVPQYTNNISTENETANTDAEKEKVLIPIYNNESGLYGYQTIQGKMVISPQFEDAKPFSEGLAAVYNGQRWGYINTKGEYVIYPKFGGYTGDEEIIVNPFINGTAGVYLGAGNANGFADIQQRQYALIDKTGRVIKYYDLIFPKWYGYSTGNIGEYNVMLDDHSYIIDSQGNILKQDF